MMLEHNSNGAFINIVQFDDDGDDDCCNYSNKLYLSLSSIPRVQPHHWFFLDIYLTMSSQKMQFSISVNKYGSILVFLILHSFVQYKIEP